MTDQSDRHTGLTTLELRDRQIAAVHTIAARMSGTLGLDAQLRETLAVAMQAVDASAGTIFLHRPADDKLVFWHVIGEKARELTGMAIDAHEGVVGSVFQSGRAQITNKPREDKAFLADFGARVGYETQSIITVPLKYQNGRPLGAIQILNKRDGAFTPSDLEVLEIVAALAAASIENTRLAQEAQVAAVAHAVGDLSHDIKNKITPIMMAAQTLKPTIDEMFAELDQVLPRLAPADRQAIEAAVRWLREFYDEQIEIILDQGWQVQEYTKRIADALKGTVTEPQIEVCELEPIIDDQIRQLDPIARNRNVELTKEIGDLPPFPFDAFFLKSAIYNLINNAIPETPPGGRVQVRATAVREGTFPDGACVILEVSDTGRGMPPHVMDRILRGDATSTKPGGTGLGTRIVYNAVRAHRGVFEGQSREGEGTTFRIKLPLNPERS